MLPTPAARVRRPILQSLAFINRFISTNPTPQASSSKPDDGSDGPFAQDFAKEPSPEEKRAAKVKNFVETQWILTIRGQMGPMAHRYPNLMGRETEIADKILFIYDKLFPRYVDKATFDERKTRNMQQVLLTAATYHAFLYENLPVQYDGKHIVEVALGSYALKILLPLHRFKTAVSWYLLGMDPYTEACRFLSVAVKDIEGLCDATVTPGKDETVLNISKCSYFDVLAEQQCQPLVANFCCQNSMRFLSIFNKYKTGVALTHCFDKGDKQCCIKISRKVKA